MQSHEGRDYADSRTRRLSSKASPSGAAERVGRRLSLSERVGRPESLLPLLERIGLLGPKAARGLARAKATCKVAAGAIEIGPVRFTLE